MKYSLNVCRMYKTTMRNGSIKMFRKFLPLNCMFGTMTFSQILARVAGSSKRCLYDGRSATEARNWIALLTSYNSQIKV